ncbi:MAG: hypothetical protein AB1716_07905 [Planctomycetota bacterium]
MTSGRSIDDFLCPRCGGNGCKRQELPGLNHLLWLITPIPPLSELILGQRLPRTVFQCVKCDQPLILRSYLRCPGCGTYYSTLLWSRANGNGHWFGLFCPDCGTRIPAALNIYSLALFGLLSPLWYPLWRAIGPRWIAWEQRRALRMRARGAAEREPVKSWVAHGMVTFGLVMWPGVAAPELLSGDRRLILTAVFVKLPIYLAGGALLGYILQKVLRRRHRWKPDHCRACGYNLYGLPTNTCPECGFHFDAGDLPNGAPAEETETGGR